MHFYSIGYGDALLLPIPVFWELSRNIDRIKAEDDLRMLRVLNNVVGGDPQKLADDLTNERGEIASTNDPATELDRTGMNRLKAMIGRGRK